MSTNTANVFIEALSLPLQSRAELAARLLTSLEEDLSSPEIEAAWKDEALERCRAFDGGELSERSSDEVFRDAYAKLG